MSAPTQLSIPNPFPVSNNLCSFQKGSGVKITDAIGCEVPRLDPTVAADQARFLYASLDDQTLWTAQAAMVSNCDECIYGPVEATLRDFVHDLKSVCCIDDSCLVGIMNAILCNPILNYRARFIEAQQAIRQVQAQNDQLTRAFAQSRREIESANANICQIVNAVKQAIASIPQDGGKGTQTRCCLAACLNDLCDQVAGSPPPPVLLPLPCPCPPISCETLANACVVIKVNCAAEQSAGAPVTCDETINCDFGCPVGGIAGGTVIAGVTYPTGCLLPTGADYAPRQGAGCGGMDKVVVLTFRGATNCVTGDPGVLP